VSVILSLILVVQVVTMIGLVALSLRDDARLRRRLRPRRRPVVRGLAGAIRRHGREWLN
jgi:threonine/homoserine/homoserine lactone efflux protein